MCYSKLRRHFVEIFQILCRPKWREKQKNKNLDDADDVNDNNNKQIIKCCDIFGAATTNQSQTIFFNQVWNFSEFCVVALF